MINNERPSGSGLCGNWIELLADRFYSNGHKVFAKSSSFRLSPPPAPVLSQYFLASRNGFACGTAFAAQNQPPSCTPAVQFLILTS